MTLLFQAILPKLGVLVSFEKDVLRNWVSSETGRPRVQFWTSWLFENNKSKERHSFLGRGSISWFASPMQYAQLTDY